MYVCLLVGHARGDTYDVDGRIFTSFFFHIQYIGFSDILCALYFGDGYTFELRDPLRHPSHLNHSDLYDFGMSNQESGSSQSSPNV